MKNICKKSLVITIILLLIGVSVSSAISIDTKQSIVSKASEEECWDCKEIDNRHLVVLEKQLNRLEVYTKLLLVLSRDNPEFKEKCEEILDVINSNRQLDYPIICAILEPIWNQIVYIGHILMDLVEKYKDNPIIIGILACFVFPFDFIGGYIKLLGGYFGCELQPFP